MLTVGHKVLTENRTQKTIKKKIMKTTILIINLLIITLTSCNPNNGNDGFTPTLPPITQTGENTFGCYVDGKLLIPRDGAGVFGSPDRGMKYIGTLDNSYNEIKIRDFKSGNGGLLTLHINELFQNGEDVFTINAKNNCQSEYISQNINVICRWWNDSTQEFNWYCSKDNSGELIITNYNFDNKIVSGVFTCTVQNRDNSNDEIEITEGRFDIKWDTLSNIIFP
jgi:hypothetical protein